MPEIWGCKIGQHDGELPPGSDLPMRKAVEKAYREITGKEPNFMFSGWGEKLTEAEYEAAESQGLL